MGLSSAFALALVALAATTVAPPPQTLQGVTVPAPQKSGVDDHRLHDFVGRVVRPASDGHLARWSAGEHICQPQVLGSETFSGALVSQRIRQEAQELGVSTGAPALRARHRGDRD